MKRKRVINNKNIPFRMPILGTLVWYLFLDNIQAPQWAWGAMGLIIIIGWIAWLIDIFNRDELEELK